MRCAMFGALTSRHTHSYEYREIATRASTFLVSNWLARHLETFKTRLGTSQNG